MSEHQKSSAGTVALIIVGSIAGLVLMFFGMFCKMVPGSKAELTKAVLVDSAGNETQMAAASSFPKALADKRGFNGEINPDNDSVIIEEDFTVFLINNNWGSYAIIVPWSDSTSSILTKRELTESFQVIDSNGSWSAVNEEKKQKEWYMVVKNKSARSVLDMSKTARETMTGSIPDGVQTSSFRFAGESYTLALTFERSQWLSPNCHWSFPGSP